MRGVSPDSLNYLDISPGDLSSYSVTRASYLNFSLETPGLG